jgi:CAAX prenyl protease-like protein
MIPMFLFLGLLQVGATWPALYPASYVARVIVTTLALFLLWPKFTRIRWDFWWMGVIVGVLGIVQWVWMQTFLEQFAWFKPDEDAFNPFKHFDGTPQLAWSFIAVRIIGAVLVVPVMEELFWRDWLWRTILAPNDFKLAQVGEFEWPAFLGVAGAFALVHLPWWPTAIVWALMIGALLIYTKSLGACILAHAVTNLLLALYVLKTHAWHLW